METAYLDAGKIWNPLKILFAANEVSFCLEINFYQNILTTCLINL